MATATKDPEETAPQSDQAPHERLDDLRAQKSELTDQLDHLNERLEGVLEKIEATSDPDAAVELRMEKQAVEDTMEDLRSDLSEVRDELSGARETKKREDDVQRLVRIAEEAEEAMTRFHSVQEPIVEAVKEHAAELEAAWADWGRASRQFQQLLRKLERGTYEPMTRHKDDREQQLDRARRLMERLYSEGAPIGAALPHPFVDPFDWTGVDREDPHPKYPDRHQQAERTLLDAVLKVAAIEN